MRLVKPLSSRGPPDGRSVTRREERRAVRVFPAAEESKGISGEMSPVHIAREARRAPRVARARNLRENALSGNRRTFYDREGNTVAARARSMISAPARLSRKSGGSARECVRSVRRESERVRERPRT